jgi:hypothetical protein
MVSEKTKLIVLALLAGGAFRAADLQKPFSLLWFVLLFGSLLSGLTLVKVLKRYESER